MSVIKKEDIRILMLGLSLLMCVFTYAQAQRISLGANVSTAPVITDTVEAAIADGTENYFQIMADNLPATVYYWPDTLFGPLPTLISVVGGDTLSAVAVVDGCRMGWRWQLAAAGEEEDVRYLYFSTHEAAATAEIQPYTCRPTASETTETACDSLYWNGEWRKQTGSYTYKTTNAAGCDSTATLHLTVNASYRITLPDAVACEEYQWGDTAIYESGTYTRHLHTLAGCDSIVTMTVTINHESYGLDEVTAYDSYTWINGTTYTASTQGQVFYATNAAGCDSIVSLRLTIRHLVEDTLRASVCPSELPYVWYGVHITKDGFYSTDTIMGVGANVDTVHNLALTVLPTYAVDTTAEACESFVWYGETYTQSGQPTHTLRSVAGCDSIVTLHLTIYHATMGDTVAGSCDPFVWYEHTCEATRDYVHTLPGANVHGCDSVLTLHFTRYTPTMGDTVAGSCDPFVWYEHTCEATRDYVHTLPGANVHGCDSVLTLHFTRYTPTKGDTVATAYDAFRWYGETYTRSGKYEHTFPGGNAHGCDSVLTLHLTIGERPIYDTVTVYYCPKSGIEEHFDSTANPIIRYAPYAYEKPSKDWYLADVVTDEVNSGANVNFLKAEQALRAYYVDPLSPVTAIYWRYRKRDAASLTEVTLSRTQPQWIETGTISIEVHFQCGQRYYDSFTVGNMTEDLEQAETTVQAEKRIENGQVVILRGGVKYTIFGTRIE